MDWVSLATLSGIWFGGIGAIGVYIHQNRKADRRYYDDKLDGRFSQLHDQIQADREKTEEEHDAVKKQITDLANTVREHYPPRREVEHVIATWNTGLNDLRADVRGLSGRIDRLAGGWHGTHSDG